MPYPIPQFKRVETISGSLYRMHPPGILDPIRLIHNEPCWLSPLTPRKEYNKILIISDWTAPAWLHRKTIEVMRMLVSLMTADAANPEPFTVYLWQANELVALSIEQVNLLLSDDVRRKMVSQENAEVLRVAQKQLKRTPEEFFLIDDYWMDHLLGEEEELKPRVTRLSDLHRAELRLSYRERTERAAQNAQSEMIIDYFNSESDSLFTKQIRLLTAEQQCAIHLLGATLRESDLTHYREHGVLHPLLRINLDVLSSFKVLEIRDDFSVDNLKLVVQKSSALNELTLHATKALASNTALESYAALPELDTLTLREESLHPQCLIQLINTSRQLVLFRLASCDIKAGDLPFQATSITHFDMQHVYDPEGFLGALLGASPHLKSIKLSNYKQDRQGLAALMAPSTANVLQDLEIEFSDLTTEQIQSILGQTRILKTLRLAYLTHLTDSLSIDALQLENLETLELKFANLSLEFVQNMVHKTPQLKALSLACRQLNKDVALFKDLHLPHLETVSLDTKDTSSDSLINLLKAMPNLKKCTLSNSLRDPLLAHLEGVRLEALEELTLCNGLIPAAMLKALQTTAPNLRIICFSNCIIDGALTLGSLAGEATGFIKLERLKLTETSASWATIQELVRVSPNLTQLYCKQQNAPDGEDDALTHELSPPEEEHSLYSLEGVVLPHLHELDVESSQITSAILENLLKSAPNLTILNLNECNELTRAIRLDGAQCTKLTKLFAVESSITLDLLASLIHIAPNLKEIDLEACRKLQGTLTLNHDSLLHLEQLDLSGANVSMACVSTFLRVCSELQELNLSNCTHVDEALTLIPGSLAQIKALKLSSIGMPLATLFNLLMAASNLEELDLSCFEASSGGCSFDAVHLHQLKILDLSRSKLPSPIIYELLGASPNLKEAYLSFCHLTAQIPFARLGLKMLEQIHILSSNINLSSFQELISTASGLRTIDISHCNNLNGRLSVTGIRLEQLESVRAYSSSISEENLHALISIAPKLSLADIKRRLIDLRPVAPTSPLLTITQSNTRTIDADTSPMEGSLSANRYFYPLDGAPDVAVGEYRLDIYDSLIINSKVCPIAEAFSLLKAADLLLTTTTPTLSADNEYHYYKGSKRCVLNDQWQALPSLDAQEVLTEIHTNPEIPIELNYSPVSNQYFIRCAAELSQEVVVDFSIAVHQHRLSTLELPEELQSGIAICQRFQEGRLELDLEQEYTGAEYLREIWDQEKGACRHRAVSFFNYLKENHPQFPSRIIINDCHARCEVFANNRWHSCDLGGYAIDLHIVDAVERDSEEETAVTDEAMGLDSGNEVAACSTQALPRHEEFGTFFRPWLSKAQATTTPDDYLKKIFQEAGVKRRLIECSSSKQLNALGIKLQAPRADGAPVFFARSAAMLCCAAPYLNAEGTLTRGPGGALYDFIHRHPNGLLVINYDRFIAEEVVRFNSILDDIRRVDNCPIPDSMQIIGLVNVNNPECYKGSDFYSRFDVRESCPLSAQEWAKGLAVIKAPPGDEEDLTLAAVDLHHAANWREMLLGQWTFSAKEEEAGSLCFKPGALQKALGAGAKRLKIMNGLWADAEFLAFWQEALYLGYIQHQGQRLAIPADLVVYREEGYDWTNLITPLLADVSAEETASKTVLLNPKTFTSFFSRFTINEAHQLVTQPGYIEDASLHSAAKELHVILHRSLDEDAFAMVLQECRTHGVRLKIKAMPGVTLPKAIAQSPSIDKVAPSAPRLWTHEDLSKTVYIRSTDADTTVAQLLKKRGECLVIDASELSGADLLYRMTGVINELELRFEFTKTPCVLTQALAANQTVIIKGILSPELVDELAELLFTCGQVRDDAERSGTLIIVNESTSLDFAQPYVHEVTWAEKEEILGRASASFNAYAHESLSQLQARLHWLTMHSEASIADSDKAWLGLSSAPTHITPLTPLDATTSASDARQFMQARAKALTDILASQPYAYLSGLTGVGKTTFVQKLFSNTSEQHLFIGKQAIRAWAKAEVSEGYLVLFIDEANLDPCEWSIFEGLYAPKPFILIDGTAYFLKPHHKVVFAGNPGYGNGRHTPSFSKRHGNSLWLDPLPTAVLYEDIIKPVFAGTPLNDAGASIGSAILETYQLLVAWAATEVLISPRELQMMALMTLAQCRTLNDETQALAIAQHYAYTLAAPLVPAAHKASFAARCKPTGTIPRKPSELIPSSFIDAPSRKAEQFLLEDMLALQALRRSTEANETHQYGGLGGIVLEGAPGIGKSEHVLAVLRAQGYKDKSTLAADDPCPTYYYRLPISFSFEEKNSLLIKAFREGALVFIDELNASRLPETLLNQLLMGYYEGERPLKPGFMIIGTQNPHQGFAGRYAASPAFARRIITQVLTPYTPDEMIRIVAAKGLARDVTADLVAAYRAQAATAQKQQLTPEPTFRDLVKVAGQIKTLYDALRDAIKPPLPTITAPVVGSKRRRGEPSDAEAAADTTETSDAAFPIIRDGEVMVHTPRFFRRGLGTYPAAIQANKRMRPASTLSTAEEDALIASFLV